MRTRVVIYALIFAITFVMASNIMQNPLRMADGPDETDSASSVVARQGNDSTSTLTDSTKIDSTAVDSLRTDSLLGDTVEMDSLRKAIFLRNKAVDDSLRADSINSSKSGTIDKPINYEAKDSIVYFSDIKKAFLYGTSNVKYDNMDLKAEKINMQLDSSIVHATGAMDTAKKERYGLPVFLMGSDKYETDTMAFNFKSKRGLIQNAYTAQNEGFLLSELSKRDAEGNFYLKHGRYTTCDDPEPDFYLALTRAKVRPGKEVIFGPAYLVVQDVPLPLAIPYGFFPFSKSYSSGFIMPTYGDESSKGFYLRDGGYYFAISDMMDLKLLGEIYTKGSWGLSAAINYKKRYKFSGQFYASYQDSRSGDEGFPDYTRSTSFKIQWSHRQDSKSNPYQSLSASVNFATSNYERNNLTSLYNPTSLTQSTRTSSISWSTRFSSIGLSLSLSTNMSQNVRDSSIALTLPNLSLSLSRKYPFKRKHASGSEKWYEKISLSYTGSMTNSISTKENKLFKSSLARDWQNGFKHSVPIQGNFTILKYIILTPSINLYDRMYLSKVKQSWDQDKQTVKRDTISGFYNVFDYNMGVSANTTLYGFYIPNRKIFGDKIQAIRHTFKPSVSFTYSPDFSTSSWGYWDSYVKTDANGNVSTVAYDQFAGMSQGSANSTMSGTVQFGIDNNIEMKVRSDKDSTGFKKISIIDLLSARMSYNLAAKERPWSDLNVTLQLKWWKNYTFTMSTSFATYAYELDSAGNPYLSNHTEYSKGRFGRFQGCSQNISYTLNPEKLRKLFGKKDKKNKNSQDGNNNDEDTGVESNVDPTMTAAQNGATKENAGMAETDADGYLKFSMPWSLTFSYGISITENRSGNFNKETMRWPYKVSQNLNFSGNIRIADGWNISFSSGYDFNYHKLSMTTASLARDLHCFNMSCSVVIAPYTSYNFSFRCNAATLMDALKYDKRSSYSNSVKWY